MPGKCCLNKSSFLFSYCNVKKCYCGFFLKFSLKTPFQGVSLKGPYTGYWKTRKSGKEKATGMGTNRGKKEKQNKKTK